MAEVGCKSPARPEARETAHPHPVHSCAAAAGGGEMTKLPRANKFNAKKAYRCLSCGAPLPGKAAACMHCGESRVHTFDSRAEARRYDALRLKLKAGFISELQVHPRYPLCANGKLLGYYEADFT